MYVIKKSVRTLITYIKKNEATPYFVYIVSYIFARRKPMPKQIGRAHV